MFSRPRALVAAVLVVLIATVLGLSSRGTGAATSSVPDAPSATDGITIQHPAPLAVF